MASRVRTAAMRCLSKSAHAALLRPLADGFNRQLRCVVFEVTEEVKIKDLAFFPAGSPR
jgi:hypothetical protein